MSDDATYNLLGFVRQLGEEARNLQKAYSAIELTSPSTADGAVEEALRGEAWNMAKAVFERNRHQATDLLTAVTRLLDANARLRDWIGLEITRIGNYWEAIQYRHERWERAAEPPTSSSLKLSITELDELIYEVGLVTVPGRLEAHLAFYRPGQILSFDSEFEDELPNPDNRRRILQYLFNHPTAVSGIIDVDAGTVTRVSSSARRRALSWIISLLLAVAVVLACAALGKWDAPSLRADVDGGDLARAAALVLAGMTAHVVVGMFKDLRRAATDPRRRFASAGNWILWGHARELYIWAAIIFAGALAYYLAGVHNQTETLTLLAVGYSGDSFVDVLLPKFEKGVVGRTEKAKAAIA